MKKRIFITLFAFILCVFTAIPAYAELTDLQEVLPRLVDEADLLSDAEESSLLSKLNEISVRHEMDIVVVTTNTLDGASAMEYADDFYDYNGYRDDGVLFLISMEERDWHISTKGFGIIAITDAGLDHISERFLPDLGEGEYAAAFDIYADFCDKFITQAKTGEPYDVGNLPKDPFDAPMNFLISLGIGLVVGFIATGVMKGQLKSVKSKAEATEYVKSGSMMISESNEYFLYRNVSKTQKAESSSSSGGSSTHTSSSGSTHGGGGGKF